MVNSMEIGNSILSLYSLLVALISGVLMIYIFFEKDEMEMEIFKISMKHSLASMLIVSVAYYTYSSINGVKTISITTIGNGIILFALLLFLYTIIAKKGYEIGFKIRSSKQITIISVIFSLVSILSVISLFMKISYFANPNGYIRYDEMILYLNFFMASLSIGFIPQGQFKTYDDYIENVKSVDKMFNIYWVIYLIVWIGIIGFAVVYPRISL